MVGERAAVGMCNPPPASRLANPSSRVLSRLSDDLRRVDEHLNNGEWVLRGPCELRGLRGRAGPHFAGSLQRAAAWRRGMPPLPAPAPNGRRRPGCPRPPPAPARAAFLGCATLLAMTLVSLVMVVISLP